MTYHTHEISDRIFGLDTNSSLKLEIDIEDESYDGSRLLIVLIFIFSYTMSYGLTVGIV